jgi:hypothetical protein
LVLDLGGGSLPCLAGEHGDQLVHGVEVWCSWSFGVEAEQVLVLDVEVSAGACAGGGDVKRFAGGGLVDEDVGGVHGAALCACGGGGVALARGAVCDERAPSPFRTSAGVLSSFRSVVW